MKGAFFQCNVAVLALAALATSPVALAQGGFHGPGRYEITNMRSGKALGLDPDRTTVLQLLPHDRDNQLWDIRAAESGFWFIVNALTKAALETMGMADRTPVRGRSFNGGPSQQWRIAAGRSGTALITNRLGKILEIQVGAGLNGASIQTDQVNGDSNQRFLLHLHLEGQRRR